MSLRRYVSLMHGLGYSTLVDAPNPVEAMELEPPRLSTKEEMKAFFGTAIRYTPSEEVTSD